MLRKPLVTLALAGMFLLAGCGPAAPTSQPPAATEAPIEVTPSSTEPVVPTPTASAIPTLEPFVAQFTPAPTETALPTQELPSPVPGGSSVPQIWDGLPTYPADSRPDFDFRLSFDPGTWALTKNDYGFPALIHRVNPGCSISPSSGHGLPPNLTVEHNVRKLGQTNFQMNITSLNGIRQFVTYSGGDGVIFSAFEVAFQDQADQCLKDAETVLATLTSVPTSQATPAPAP